MNNPRFQCSKHSHDLLISYGHCSNCATCAISGKVVGARGNRWKLLKDDLKCYIPYQILIQSSYNEFLNSPYINMCPCHFATYGTSDTI